MKRTGQEVRFCSLTKAQAVTYGVLGKQDGALRVAFHLIHNPAKANPAGIHSVQYVGRCNISMHDPDGDCIEGDLENKPSMCIFLTNFYFETSLHEISNGQSTALGS